VAACIRKVRTASGATAVRIAAKRGDHRMIVEHVGSAHTDSELVALMQLARSKLHAGQEELDLGLDVPDDSGKGASLITAKRSRWLIEAVETAWRRFGFDGLGDDAFFQLVLARLVEPTSMSDTARVVGEIGLDPVHRNTYANALKRCATRDYRDRVATRCFEHAALTGGLSLVLYDVTTLYFEAEKKTDSARSGTEKDRRVDPQIVVSLLVDRTGFPLEIGCFEGNKAETHTIVPMIRQFQARHDIVGV